jgi:hypothetical protein
MSLQTGDTEHDLLLELQANTITWCIQAELDAKGTSQGATRVGEPRTHEHWR